jgi:hypothetical protein
MPQAWAERLLPSSRRLISRANSILAARAASRQGGEKTLDARPGPSKRRASVSQVLEGHALDGRPIGMSTKMVAVEGQACSSSANVA